MISEKAYISKLAELFLKTNQELFQQMEIWKQSFCLYGEDEHCRELISFLEQIEHTYGFDMQAMCRTNYQLLTIWQNQFLGKTEPILRDYALKFLTVCCLVDKILDSRRFQRSEKEKIVEFAGNLIDNNQFSDNISSGFKELDSLFSKVWGYVGSRRHEQSVLKVSVKDAIYSEIYLWQHPLREWEDMEDLSFKVLTDKSIAFERSALLLALPETSAHQAERPAEQIARIIWLSDDLCDFTDDIKNRRQNSLLCMAGRQDSRNLEKRCEAVMEELDKFVRELERAIDGLHACAGDDLFYFVVSMVQKWFGNIEKIIEN